MKDIIKYEANVKGGVHLGSPRKDVEKEIDQEIFCVGGLRFTLRQLISIARVTLEALKPLFIALVDIEKRRS